jgi:hypothetical protein
MSYFIKLSWLSFSADNIAAELLAENAKAFPDFSRFGSRDGEYQISYQKELLPVLLNSFRT